MDDFKAIQQQLKELGGGGFNEYKKSLLGIQHK